MLQMEKRCSHVSMTIRKAGIQDGINRALFAG